MYIEIGIEIACDQNEFNFSPVLIRLAKKTFLDFRLVFDHQFAFEYFENYSDHKGMP